MEELFANLDYKSDGKINYFEFLAATLESKVQIDDEIL